MMENTRENLWALTEFEYNATRYSEYPVFEELSSKKQRDEATRWANWLIENPKNLELIEKLTEDFEHEKVAEGDVNDIPTLLSHLVRCAGQYCENNSSEILDSWQLFDIFLRFEPMYQFTMYFGFYADGVDNNSLVAVRLQENFPYKALYRIDVDMEENSAVLTKLQRKD